MREWWWVRAAERWNQSRLKKREDKSKQKKKKKKLIKIHFKI